MPVMIMVDENGKWYGSHYCQEYRHLYWMAVAYKKARPDRKFIVFHNDKEAELAGFVRGGKR